MAADTTSPTDATTDAPTLEFEGAVEVEEQLADLINQLVPNAALAGLLSKTAFILFILLVAAILVSLARRGIARMVARMKDPDAPRGRRLRSRIGLVDAEVEDLRRAQRADSLGGLASSVVTVVIWTLAGIMALGQIGVQVGPLIAGAGIVGVALGFGAQDLVKDFLSGVFMMIEDQFGVGDIIDVGEAAGVVEGISLRSTRVRDIQGTLWHVPNGEIRRVGNMSQEWARALLDVAVAYGTDVDAASELLLRIATEMAGEEAYRELFMDDPQIWGVENLGDDSVDIRLVIKTQPGEQWAICRELRRRIKNGFDAAEVEIPFAQRTVWLRTEQPVAFGDAEAPGFDHPIPDEAAMQRAVAASKRGDTGPDVNEFAELLPDEPDVPTDGASDTD